MNGRSFRGVIGRFGAERGIIVGPAWRRDGCLETGARVIARLAPEGPLRQTLDADVAAALEAEPAAVAFFDGLAQFYRKAWLKWIDGTKRRPEERARRIAELVEHLKAGRKARDPTGS